VNRLRANLSYRPPVAEYQLVMRIAAASGRQDKISDLQVFVLELARKNQALGEIDELIAG